MLAALSGRSHHVHTAFALRDPAGAIAVVEAVSTLVRFADARSGDDRGLRGERRWPRQGRLVRDPGLRRDARRADRRRLFHGRRLPAGRVRRAPLPGLGFRLVPPHALAQAPAMSVASIAALDAQPRYRHRPGHRQHRRLRTRRRHHRQRTVGRRLPATATVRSSRSAPRPKNSTAGRTTGSTSCGRCAAGRSPISGRAHADQDDGRPGSGGPAADRTAHHRLRPRAVRPTSSARRSRKRSARPARARRSSFRRPSRPRSVPDSTSRRPAAAWSSTSAAARPRSPCSR